MQFEISTTEEFLLEFGFRKREILIYMSLFSVKEATPAELSKITKIERSDTYRILEDLVNKGFLIKLIDKPVKYTIADPEKAFKESIEEKRVSVQRLESNIGQLNDSFNSKKNKSSIGIGKFEVIKSERHVTDRVKEMVSPERCKREILYYATADCGRRIAIGLQEQMNEAFKRKVSIRLMMPTTEDNLKYVKMIAQVADIRHIPFSLSRIIIVDRKECLLIYNSINSGITRNADELGLWICNTLLSETQATLFESQWRQAIHLKSRIRQIKKQSNSPNPAIEETCNKLFNSPF